MARRRNFNTDGLTNLKMDSDTYALRRKVMGFIYEAKEVVDLPRIDIRIADKKPTMTTLGRAVMGGRMIWITTDALSRYTHDELRHIVFHELCHAVGSVMHDKLCPLMSPFLAKGENCSQSQARKLLKKYLG